MLTINGARFTSLLMRHLVRVGRLVTRRGPRWTLPFIGAGAAIVVFSAAGASQVQQTLRAERVSHRTLAAQPRCFGAAARDPEHPCDNPRLKYAVVPTPSDAQITPSAPCTPIQQTRKSAICAFGVRSSKAVATIALLGDSHAVHWRAALEVVARAKRWRGLTIYRSQCPFSEAISSLPEPARSECSKWNRNVPQWFHRHPNVSTVFVSEHSYAGIIAPRGQDVFAAKVAGYMNAWKALPTSVKHIIVIRDTPYNRTTTIACVERAMAKRQPAGLVCALPRSAALVPDAAAVGATQVGSPRVELEDLTPFMCDSQLCYPVIGGALVHKDNGHLTRVFATTLGPFLLRDVNRLMASWR
jgi:hypothetical protein